MGRLLLLFDFLVSSLVLLDLIHLASDYLRAVVIVEIAKSGTGGRQVAVSCHWRVGSLEVLLLRLVRKLLLGSSFDTVFLVDDLLRCSSLGSGASCVVALALLPVSFDK
jgi:hypothetical protein